MSGKLVDYLKKFWDFVWHGESISSWVVCFILAFLLIQYVLYPGLGYVLGAKYPVVAVVSGSMEHKANFDDWWDSNCNGMPVSQIYTNFGFDKETFMKTSFKNGFNTGDLMVLYSPENVKKGDVIVFMSSIRPDPIIHRVVEIYEDGKFYKTKGDNKITNCDSADFEKKIPREQVIGKAMLRLPYLGWVKLAFVNLLELVGYNRL